MAADGGGFDPTVPVRNSAAQIAPMPCTRASAGLSARALSRALAFIEQRMCDGFTLDELARTAAISRFHFARQFRVSTGYSPMGYLLHRRIEQACDALRRDCGCIADIAAGLGFFDQSHFTRTFRRVTGMTPRAWAKAPQPARETAA